MTQPNRESNHDELATFVIHLEECNHGTWQGRVDWLDADEHRYYRSALELFRLIESAVLSTQPAKQEVLVEQ